MPKSYRAKVGFSCPADPVSLSNRMAMLEGRGGGDIDWMDVKKGDLVEPFDKSMLKDWLERGLVKEVNS